MYDRWGITNADAETLTGTATGTLTDAALTAAEDEIVDVIGWEPDPTAYDPTTDVRARGFGRAVAWQAAYRLATVAAAGDGSGVRIASESLGGDASVSYAGAGAPERPILAPRARDLLSRGGWYRLSGTTSGRRGPSTFDAWQRNEV